MSNKYALTDIQVKAFVAADKVKRIKDGGIQTNVVNGINRFGHVGIMLRQ